MLRRLAILMVPAVTFVLAAPPVDAEDGRGEITAAQVRAAIEKGLAYLKSVQRADGSWDDYAGYDGGVSCLCTLALLNAAYRWKTRKCGTLWSSSAVADGKNVCGLAANDGLVPGRTEEGSLADQEQRAMAGEFAE